ncbi:MAG: asparagine synthase (glutamine-hydrolyzing) [Woeseiaceae bacterium]|nr:asparagine synthase (glutamine-hydrolyzing) [Woeseiaceae bacterium]
MCGLVAVIGRNGRPVDARMVARMADTLAHRGPDDQGAWHRDDIGLHHRRLTIIDLVSGQQPMSRDGVTVAFNGEIYNFVELRKELEEQGVAFETTSDTEVLLQSYLTWGSAHLQKLVGMFAFVIHDANKRRVMVARDHFGIKPMYRYDGDDFVIYASEIKAILAHDEVRAEVDANALDDYLTFQYTLGEHTLFRGVSKLLPAHFEVHDFDSGNRRSERFWDPSYKIENRVDEDTAVARLRDMLQESVRMQMRSDVPVGAYLSGGLDSSTVTVLASNHTDQALQTFSGAFREGPEYDETQHARAVAESVGARMHVIHPSESEFIDALPGLVYSMDEPAAGPGLFPQYMVSKLASENVKVCLGGQGGDEIFGGYARYPIAILEQLLKSGIQGDTAGNGDDVTLAEFAEHLPSLQQYMPLMKRFYSNGLFESFDRRYFSLVDRSEGALAAYTPEFQASYSHAGAFSRFQEFFDRPQTDSLWNRMLYFDMTTSLPALLQVEDRVSMSVSLESRVPLLDHRVVDFVATLPAAVKWKGGEMKYLFKRAIAPWLPESVMQRRDKMGFPVPLQIWAQGKARDFFCDVLLSRQCRERGLFDIDVVETLINEEAAFSRVLWGLLQIELWHQQFIDKPQHEVKGVEHAFEIG